MSTNTKIAKAYIILIAASIFGNILSMGKEMLSAKYFGITKAMDAYYVALTIPNFIYAIITSIFVFFIPIFIKHRTHDKEEANKIASIVVNYLFIFLVLSAIVIFVFANEMLRYGFRGLDTETYILSVKILRIICFTVIFSGLISMLSSILNAYEHFTWPAFSQTFITISVIILILFFTKKWGVFVFVWGLLIGLLIQFAFLAPISKKKGYKHYLSFNWRHPAIKEILQLSFIFYMLSILGSLNPFINRTMASWLPSGSIAALSYADKLVQVPLMIFSGTIATAIYPFLSTQIAENKIEDMKDSLATGIKMTGFIFIPMAVIMIILARPTIKLLFQRGIFDAQATDLTSVIYICYTFQLFTNYAAVIINRIFLIYKDMMVLFKIVLLNILLTIILNFIFMKIINPPAAGIALSASVTSLFITIFLFKLLKKRINNIHGISIIKSLIKTTFFALISGLMTFIAFQGLSILFPTPSFLNHFIQLAGASIIGLTVFAVISYLMKFKEAEKIFYLIKNKFGTAF
ncbi:MAG TPA: murein biosynthesis integral membrane protein MurJ [Elusimicrobia bacterium]|nr:murein biosynthesis integral membrane protein MurJ [Elusimicrobiota bacterium]